MTKHVDPRHLRVAGAFGGGKGGGGGGIKEKPNTLRSDANIRIIDLLGEGEIRGLVNGAQSIYLDDTPLQNPDGTYNFKDFTWDIRNGTQDQTWLEGFPSTEADTQVNLKIYHGVPQIKTISDPGFDRARVTVMVAGLTKTNDKGEVQGSQVDYTMEVRYNGGPWQTVVTDSIKGKTTSQYYRSKEFALPKNPGGGASNPWDIRVTRVTADADSATTNNDLYLNDYTAIIDTKFTYPNSVVVGCRADARQFGSNIPTRSYEVYGRIIQVPSNYDPNTRSYSGLWDGTFKDAWTDNPAWVFYDILVNDRFGLGEFIDPSQVDRYGLYEIAQYCDQLVDNGSGGQEPRFTFNGIISDAKDAYEMLSQFAAAFRGMVYWSSGMVMATQDRVRDPVQIATPSNVVDGNFIYSSTALNARHTAARVRWNSPLDGYKINIEPFELQSAIIRYGYRETDIDALGCTSRGQARRIARWTLYTEWEATQLLQYQAGLDHSHVRPGDIVAVQDPMIAGVDLEGRINASSTASHIILDAPVTFESGKTYKFACILPSGAFQEVGINVPATNTPVQAFDLSTSLNEVPSQEGVFGISSSTLVPALYTVIGIKESAPNLYDVTLAEHQPSIFDQVDNGGAFEPLPTSTWGTAIGQPKNLTVKESVFYRNGVPHTRTTFAWSQPDLPTVATSYHISVVYPDGGVVDFGNQENLSIDFDDLPVGDYEFGVAVVSINGKAGLPATYDTTISGWEGVAIPTVTNLQVQGGGTTFSSDSCFITWGYTFPSGIAPYTVPVNVSVFDVSTSLLLRSEDFADTNYGYTYQMNIADGGPRRTFKFVVTPKDLNGNLGAPANLTVNNPVPAAINPTVNAAVGGIVVQFPPNPEYDWAGNILYLSTTNGFTPGAGNQVFDGKDALVALSLNPGTYYVRAAAYDTFGKTGLNVSAQVTVTVASNVIDTTQPNAPGTPTLTAGVSVLSDGTIDYNLTASWTQTADSVTRDYELEFIEGSSNALNFYTAGKNYVWHGLKPNTTYKVRVRARSGVNVSAYSAQATVTTATSPTAPSAPTALTVSTSFSTVFLGWTPPANTDIEGYEVWYNTTNTAPSTGTTTNRVAIVSGASATATQSAGTTRYYFVRAFNTSGQFSGFSTGISATTALVTGIDVATGTITGSNIQAGSVTGDRIQANTLAGDRFVTTTSLPGTITVGSTGVSIGTMQTQADDPATRVNAKTTLIQPGKILLSGSTTLTSWQNGSDTTKIEGGNVAANTIAANSLKIGVRGIGVTGIDFSANASTNTVSWTAGTISYTADNGSATSASITASSVTSASAIYLYWAKGATTISNTTSYATANTGENILLASYTGAAGLNVLYGGTIVDGTRINAGTITSAQIAANTIQAANIAAGTITGSKIAAGTITAANLVLADTTNLAPNPNFEQGATGFDGWTAGALTGGSSVKGTNGSIAGSPSAYSINFTGTADAWITSALMPVTAGDSFRIGAWLFRSSAGNTLTAGTLYARINFWDKSGASIIGSGINVSILSMATDTFSPFTAPVTAPANAAYASVILGTSGITGGSTNVAIAYPSMVRMANASLVVDGSITANAIAAKAVQAQHLFLGDPSNALVNGNFVDANGVATLAGWNMPGAPAQYPENDNTQTDTTRTRAKCYERNNRSAPITVQGGEAWYLTAYCYNTDPSNNCNIYAQWLDSSGATISYVLVAGTNAKNQWWYLGGQVTVPNGAAYLIMDLENDRADGNNSTNNSYPHYWTSCRVRRAVAAELVVDGSITAVKIAARTISADRLIVGGVTFTELTLGAATNVAAAFTDAFDTGSTAVRAIQSVGTTTVGGSVVVQSSCEAYAPGTIVANTSRVDYQLYRDGGLVYTTSIYVYAARVAMAFTFVDYPGSGSHTYQLNANPQSMGNAQFGRRSLVTIESRR